MLYIVTGPPGAVRELDHSQGYTYPVTWQLYLGPAERPAVLYFYTDYRNQLHSSQIRPLVTILSESPYSD